ncbi:MAG: hypothetical protein GY869_22780, partial [Planctomycetes bacterium]|nr:hypothetical protein [Planctomycetota bacterium]
MNIAQKYRKSRRESWCLRFKTVHPDGDNYDGVITDIKRSFVVLREQRDFEFDGLNLLFKKFIKGYRDGRFEICLNEIIRDNGQINPFIRLGAPEDFIDDVDGLAQPQGKAQDNTPP